MSEAKHAGAAARLRQLLAMPRYKVRSLRPSFSQHGEDSAIVSLLRPRARGTYVDVGANHPTEGSNTAFLYYLGWSGLTIDPNPAFSEPFRKLRARDVHLTMGVSEEPDELSYFEFDNSVFNTFLAERRDSMLAEGCRLTATRSIPCRPLFDLVREHLGERHVDLLSVDCEGLDLEVLRSARLKELRPTVLIVEDFERYFGFRDGSVHSEQDAYLRAQGYSPIWQGGWSAMYVANDWRSLPDGAFDPPRELGQYMPRPGPSSVEQPVLASDRRVEA